jgi:hypothetical protein
MKPHTHWQVLPHGELEHLGGDNLYTVTGTLKMPFAETTRRMTIARLSGGRLAVYSAMSLAEPEMRRIEALGRPAFLIVPGALHRLDIRPWKERYPDLVVIAPEGALDAVGEVVEVDTTSTQLGDYRELAMIVTTPTGRTLIVNDVIFNLPAVPGVAGLGLKALGFGPGHPSVPKLVRFKLVADQAELRDQLRAWAYLPGLERLLVSHGAPIEPPQQTLLALAEHWRDESWPAAA